MRDRHHKQFRVYLRGLLNKQKDVVEVPLLIRLASGDKQFVALVTRRQASGSMALL